MDGNYSYSAEPQAAPAGTKKKKYSDKIHAMLSSNINIFSRNKTYQLNTNVFTETYNIQEEKIMNHNDLWQECLVRINKHGTE